MREIMITAAALALTALALTAAAAPTGGQTEKQRETGRAWSAIIGDWDAAGRNIDELCSARWAETPERERCRRNQHDWLQRFVVIWNEKGTTDFGAPTSAGTLRMLTLIDCARWLVRLDAAGPPFDFGIYARCIERLYERDREEGRLPSP